MIIEDDPYFFLQFPGYDLETNGSEYKKMDNEEYLSSLVPSFLQFDYQGRVIRLESFSKTLAPGLRLGYFVASPQMTERLLRATEVDTQEPSGVSQALVLATLNAWGLDGYVTWLQNLRLEYQRRRDWMVGALRASFDLLPASAFPELGDGAEGLVAAIPGPGGVKVPVFSFIAPTAGMFLWCKVYLSQNPKYQALVKSGAEDPEQAIADQLWDQWAESLVRYTASSLLVAIPCADRSFTTIGSGRPRPLLPPLAGCGHDEHQGSRCRGGHLALQTGLLDDHGTSSPRHDRRGAVY